MERVPFNSAAGTMEFETKDDPNDSIDEIVCCQGSDSPSSNPPPHVTPPLPPPPPYSAPPLMEAVVWNGSYVSLTSSSQADACRICHCEAEVPGAPLIAPCSCAGTLKYVHQACLQQWIKSANTKSCELCKLDFQMTTSVKPFRKWQKLDMTKVERRKIVCSVTFHIIAITCVVWSLYVLIDRTTEEVRGHKLEWPFWTKLVVVAIGFTGGLVFMYVQCKMYVQLCWRWRAYNRVIYVQDCPTSAARARKRLVAAAAAAAAARKEAAAAVTTGPQPGGEAVELQAL